MEVWLLTFYIVFGGSFVGGEYISADRCEQSARVQLVHWRANYKRPIIWRCRPIIQ
jgi:hypothetical protein